MSSEDNISSKQAAYYGGLLRQHGKGVDAVASGKQVYKDLRFRRLCRVFGDDPQFSLHDVGFGLCHFYEYLKRQFSDREIEYSGSEVTSGFLQAARTQHPECQFHLRDIVADKPSDHYDYVVLGGTLYHLAGADVQTYAAYVRSILSTAFAMCTRGLVFNFVTAYVDYRHDDLFYGDVGEISRFVAGQLSRFFVIEHDYPLFEYTMCVYTSSYMSKRYPDAAFDKYFPERRAEHA